MDFKKEQWNEFLYNQPTQAGIFLQSYEWGEFQENVSRKTFRFEINKKHVQVFEHALKFGFCYWYVPRVFIDDEIIEFLKTKANERRAIFLRFEPLNNYTKGKRVKSVQPSQTSLIDVRKNNEEFFASMRQKTRYNIRLARKKGVEVELDFLGKYTDDFIRLIHITSDRNQFNIHPDNYYKKQIDAPSSFLAIARYNGEIIAAHLYWEFGDTITYLHGASSNKFRNVMAPHLVHFEVMKYARNNNYKYYDLWGIDDKKWPELTRFKRGFGGKEINYIGCFVVVLRNCLYFAYRILSLIL